MAKKDDGERTPTSVLRFKLEGDNRTFEIDAKKLTYGEMAEAEALFNCSYNDIDFFTIRWTLFLLTTAVARVDKALARRVENFEPDDIEVLNVERPTKPPKTSGAESS